MGLTNGDGLRHITGGIQVREHIPEARAIPQDTLLETRRDMGFNLWVEGSNMGINFE